METPRKWRCGIVSGSYDAVNIAIAYYMVILCIYSSFEKVLPGIIMTGIQLIFYGLVVNALKWIVRSLNVKHVYFIFIFIVIFIVSLFIAKDIDVFREVGLTLMRGGIPLFFLGASVRDCEDLLSKLRRTSWTVLLIIYVSTFVTKSSGNILDAYSQDVGYQVVMPFVLFFADYMVKKRKLDLIGMLLSIIGVLMGGARGPLLCIVIAFFVTWLLFGNFEGKNALVTVGALAVGSVLFFVFYEDILNILMNFFEEFGISTRLLMGLANNSLADDSSRSILRNFAIDYAVQHPVLGTGIINDRKLIYDNLTINSNKTVYGYYCHNFFLENMMQFGLIPGIVIGGIWLKIIIKPMLKFNEINIRSVAVIMCTIGFLPLMVSYSYITYQYFFLMVGFVLAYKSILYYKEITGE